MRLHPLHQFVYLFRIPCPARILRCQYQRRHHLSFLDGVEHTVATHAVEVASAQTGTVEEDHQRKRMPSLLIVSGGVDPEIVVARHGTAHSLEISPVQGLRSGLNGHHPQQEYPTGPAHPLSEKLFVCHHLLAWAYLMPIAHKVTTFSLPSQAIARPITTRFNINY